MSYFEYISDTKVLSKIDEKYLGSLLARGNSGTWFREALLQTKKDACALFESYAVNKYTLVELRTDPPPEFAVKMQLDIILYEVYKSNKRHIVPKAIKEEYQDTMEMMKTWGDPVIIIDDGNPITVSSRISGNRSAEDLEFLYEDIKDTY